jgi:hypothetical protein
MTTLTFTRHETNERVAMIVLPVTIFVTRDEVADAITTGDVMRLALRKREAAFGGLGSALAELPIAIADARKRIFEIHTGSASSLSPTFGAGSPSLSGGTTSQTLLPPGGGCSPDLAGEERSGRDGGVSGDAPESRPVEGRALSTPTPASRESAVPPQSDLNQPQTLGEARDPAARLPFRVGAAVQTVTGRLGEIVMLPPGTSTARVRFGNDPLLHPYRFDELTVIEVAK